MPRRRHRILRALLRLVAALLVIAIPVVLRSQWEISHTRLVHLDVTSPKIATGHPLRILQVTDVHDLPRADQRAAIVDMARQEHPDLIAVTGDLENVFTQDISRVGGFIGDLTALGIPLYYIPGNHENDNPNRGAQAADVARMVERHGGVALLNSHVTQDGPWGQLDVIGTDDYYTQRGDLAAAMRGTRPAAYHLVLSHAPIPRFVDVLATSDADLTISGHTHGGQVRLPGFGALYTPGGGFPPKYAKGLFTVGRGHLYVDSGVGQSVPLRLNDQSEVTLITVRHS